MTHGDIKTFVHFHRPTDQPTNRPTHNPFYQNTIFHNNHQYTFSYCNSISIKSIESVCASSHPINSNRIYATSICWYSDVSVCHGAITTSSWRKSSALFIGIKIDQHFYSISTTGFTKALNERKKKVYSLKLCECIRHPKFTILRDRSN